MDYAAGILVGVAAFVAGFVAFLASAAYIWHLFFSDEHKKAWPFNKKPAPVATARLVSVAPSPPAPVVNQAPVLSQKVMPSIGELLPPVNVRVPGPHDIMNSRAQLILDWVKQGMTLERIVLLLPKGVSVPQLRYWLAGKYRTDWKTELDQFVIQHQERRVVLRDKTKIGCPQCDGNGQRDGYNCGKCNARGYIYTHRVGQPPCRACLGLGKKGLYSCGTCDGVGLMKYEVADAG